MMKLPTLVAIGLSACIAGCAYTPDHPPVPAYRVPTGTFADLMRSADNARPFASEITYTDSQTGAVVAAEGIAPSPIYTAPSAEMAPTAHTCVGVCYGVISPSTGRPRNSYVRGYTRRDGTYVRPYTRSRR